MSPSADPVDRWEYAVLGVYDYEAPGKFRAYYEWLQRDLVRVEGDVLEAGVYRGVSLLATALLLKRMGSDRRVYGFDTFSGFPPVYHPNDAFEAFDRLRDEGRITAEHHAAHRRLLEYRRLLDGPDSEVTPASISGSGDFSAASRRYVERRAEVLGLDNIVLVEGTFEETMAADRLPELRLAAALLDCDLYDSYRIALPFIWDRLASGGFVFLDEYYSLKFPGARIACDEFFAAQDARPQRAEPEEREFERWFVVRS